MSAADLTGGGAGPLLPAYGRASLADLMPAVSSSLGLDGAPAQLGLPAAKHVVVALVDGLGQEQLLRHRGHARYLAGLAQHRAPLTATLPSTTATSLTSLGTGRPPGEHGMVGYTFRPSADAAVMNALAWDRSVDPLSFQPHATRFEQLADAGVAVARVLPARFEGSGLTDAGLRGGRFVPMRDEHDLDRRTSAVLRALSGAERSVVYVYERMLDHCGHSAGVASDAWVQTLEEIDGWLSRLARRLPSDALLLVTGDHGMIDVPQQHRAVIDDQPELASGVDAVAGEGRFRQLYTAEPQALARRWSLALGERAWVRTREQAIDEGWFGPRVDERVAPRIGDVLVALREDWAVMSRSFAGEFSLVGMHGSLTEQEMLVPLIVDDHQVVACG